MSNFVQPHIRCGVKDGARYAILPGDPGRVDRVKGFLENPRDIAYNREFKTAAGYYKGMRLGELIIPSGAVRNEGTADAYIERGYPALADMDVNNT